MPASMLGTTVGRYRLLEELGRGGMATVYRAEDTALGRAVAVKVLHTFLVDHPEMKQRFLREARAIAALRHPHILAVHDFGAGDADTPPYIVTELVPGPSLAKFIGERGAPLPDVAALMALEIADALAAAHAAGIVHRDVKPDNVLVGEGGRVILGDFGVARMAGEGTVTATGALVGSPAYMSPEQARGEEVDARSDVFSLGTTLYHLAAGVLPFQGKNPLGIINAILAGRHSPPTRANAAISGELERVIERCLAAAPSSRFASAAEVVAALRALLEPAGLGDSAAELRDYFANPGEYNARLTPRVIAAALGIAREAAHKGQAARALRACDRVLALDPGNQAARELVASLGARSRLRRAAVVVAALGLVATGAFLIVRTRKPARAVAVSPRAPLPAAVRAPEVVPDAAAPDAAAVAVKPRRLKPVTPVAIAAAPPPPDAAPPTPEVAPAPRVLAHLTVRAIPFCRPLLLDGQPLIPPYSIAVLPGPHLLRCVHPQRAREEKLELHEGENPVVLRVFDDATLEVAALDGEVYVDGHRCERTCKAPVGAVALELRKGGQTVESKPLFDLPPGTCRLQAAPLRCGP